MKNFSIDIIENHLIGDFIYLTKKVLEFKL